MHLRVGSSNRKSADNVYRKENPSTVAIMIAKDGRRDHSSQLAERQSQMHFKNLVTIATG